MELMEYLAIMLVVFFLGRWLLGAAFKKKPRKKNNLEQSWRGNEDDAMNWQVATARSSYYYSRSLLNESEKRVFWQLVKLLKEVNSGGNVFPQVNMGAYMGAKDHEGFKVINCKRGDFLITDKSFKAVAIIEYHGRGHYESNFEERDQVKRISSGKAGITYFVIRYSDHLDSKCEELKSILIKKM